MGYIAKKLVLKAYKTLSDLTEDHKQGQTQIVSILRHFLSLDNFYRNNARGCNLSNPEDKAEFSLHVRDIVNVCGDYYTTNFYTTIKELADCGVGSNFFSAGVVKNSIENSTKTYDYPTRGKFPLFNVKNNSLYWNEDFIDNITNYLRNEKFCTALIIWLIREKELSDFTYDQIRTTLEIIYTSQTINKILPLEEDFFEYVGEDRILQEEKSIFSVKELLDLFKETIDLSDEPLQKIVYGAPGTGKSHGTDGKIKEIYPDKEAEKDYVYRTTFHPDSDYSTFVGCYKPTKKVAQKMYSYDELVEKYKVFVAEGTLKKINKATLSVRFGYDYHDSLALIDKEKEHTFNDIIVASGNTNSNDDTHMRSGMALYELYAKEAAPITYEFVPQSFTKAYFAAWKTKLEGENKPVFLVIEEINRGNCAQIFGDLFQLLDRNEDGFSEYPIKPDTDLGNYLKEEFKKAGLTSEEYKAVVDGEELILPNNLYIWATMNTSDQSLFPIDSAFKRRWDWEYRPINHEAQSGWKIEADKPYSWSSFLEKINKEIEDTTSSEDKQLGFFFCKAEGTDEDGNNGTITAEKFVSKVLFYLYNDVFKDYGFDREFFKYKDGDKKGKVITFRSFYQMDGKINEKIVAELLNNLGVEEIKSTSNEDDQNFDSDTIDAGKKEHKETLVAVTIDGERLTADGTTQFDLYLSAIKKLGIARIAPVIESMKYRRKGSPMATKTQVQGVLDSSDYSYVEAEGYYFVKGANGYTLIRILEDLNENLSLNIKVEYK